MITLHVQGLNDGQAARPPWTMPVLIELLFSENVGSDCNSCCSSARTGAQEKARREEKDRRMKEAKAAETQQRQAEAQRLAGERAEERDRKRKLAQASQVQTDLPSQAATHQCHLMLCVYTDTALCVMQHC